MIHPDNCVVAPKTAGRCIVVITRRSGADHGAAATGPRSHGTRTTHVLDWTEQQLALGVTRVVHTGRRRNHGIAAPDTMP